MTHTKGPRLKRPGHRSRAKFVGAALITASLLAACNSGSDDAADTTAATTAATAAPVTEPADTTAATEPAVTEPADTTAATEPADTTPVTEAPAADVVDQTLTGDSPGVTDDTIKIGITYVDTEALKAVGLNYDLGDHEATYNALIADINANGGINGRQLEAVFAPIDPTNAAGAEAACLKLTEDDDVFLVTGFFLGDATMCPLEAHTTAVVGGGMTPDLAARAVAPWATWTPDADQASFVTREFADRGLFEGKTLGVYYAVADEADYTDNVKPVLDELGIDVAAVGVNDAPTGDPVASQNTVNLIAERFKAAGVDTLLLVGIGVPQWPINMAGDSYDPDLLFTEVLGAHAFATSADTTDTSILEGSISGGQYGPDQARYEQETMQECVAILDDGGVAQHAPNEFDPADTSTQPYQAAFQACPDIWLAKALIERAGKNLNYGTLAAAIDGLKITIPGDPVERTYGPPPAADGDPTPTIFGWDEATKSFVVAD